MIKMRRITAVLFIAVVVFGAFSIALADSRTAKDYMAEGIRVAYDNMHLVYQAYYDENGELEEQPGGYVAIEQEWDGNQLISRTYLGSDGEPVNRAEGYCKVNWSNGDIVLYNTVGTTIPLDGINLARDVKVGENGWSDWIKPKYDELNSTFRIGVAELGEKEVGDSYTCSFEIEFRDVTATKGGEDKRFNFRAQGATDGQWIGANVWNGSLIYLDEPIENGTRKCVATIEINEAGVGMLQFDLGFRCDYWASGEFRIRNVKVERGATATEWTPPI